ncbi:MAG: O-antigen/teichoic acid export membrane protein, partial [Candidatus Binatia bacterium]
MGLKIERPKSSLARFAEDVTGTVGTRMLTMALGLVTGIITARMLGPENRGIFSLVALFPATLVTLTKFGQSQATVYFIRREREDVSAVASNVFVFGSVVGLTLMALVVAFADPIRATILKGVPLWCLMIVLPMIPILLVESYLYGALQATDRFRVFNTRLMAESLCTLGGMAVVLWILDLGLPGALGVVITIRLSMTAWLVTTLHAETPIHFRFDFPLFRRMIRYGMKSHIQIIASHFHFKAGVYLVAYYLSPTHVAFYAIGARLAEQMMYLPQSLGLALFPRLAGTDDARIHRLTAAACRQTLLLSVGAAWFLTSVGPMAITAWYGPEYAAAGVPLRYIAWGIVMMSMYVLLSRDFTARDRQLVNIFAAYVALIGNVVLNVILIPKMGIEGAAIGTTVSYSIAAGILFVAFVRESGLPW